MSTGTLLRRAKLNQDYDSIIIGSGISGLTAAVCLAKAGLKVLVLEQHYTAGGFTHTFQHKGFEWDVGVHYIGRVQDSRSPIRRIFDYLTDRHLQWADMGQVYDRIYIGDEVFDYQAGELAFQKKMVEYFPDEAAAISQYLALIKKVNRDSSQYFMLKILPNFFEKVLYSRLSQPFLSLASKTTAEVLQGITHNKKLIAVLTAQWGDYGLPPAQSSFGMHALVARHYIDGASYPVGGSARIAATINAELERYGGQLITGAPVTSVLLKGQQAIGVKLVDGREIKAQKIISSIGMFNTLQELLPKELAGLAAMREGVQEIGRSMSHVCLFIGIKSTAKELGLPKHNLWLYPDAEHDQNLQRFTQGRTLDFPLYYVSFPSAKDPEWDQHYPGKSTIQIIAPIPFAWFEAWQGTDWQKRGPDYLQLKQQITEKCLEQLFKRLPQLKDKIDFTELSTPLSTAHFARYQKGEIYGLNHSPKRFSQRWLRAETPVKNLFFTGQDTVTAGIGGALMAGVLSAIRVLGPLKGKALFKLI